MEKYLVAAPHPDAGLCNRLKCLISILRLSEHTSSRPLLYWPINFTCGAKFSDLFENPFPQITDRQFQEIKQSKNYLSLKSYEDLSTATPYLLSDSWRFLLVPGEVPNHFAQVFPEEEGESIDLEYERIPIQIQKIFLTYIKSLKPKKEILRQVNQFSKRYRLKKRVGLHIRRTEFLLNADGRGKVSSDEKFFEAIQALINKDSSTKFFLATDDKETEERYREALGEKLVVFPSKNWDKSTKESAQHALIDLLLLSHTPMILGTYLSTFTEMAWWFGGCSARVTIIGDDQEKRRVVERYKHTSQSRIFSLLREPLRLMRRRSKFFRKIIDTAIQRIQ